MSKLMRILCAVVFVICASNQIAAAAPQYSLKIGHESAPGSMMDHMAKTFKEYVEKESKGAIAVSIFPSNQIGDPFTVLQGMQAGVIEMGILNGGSIATVLKEFSMFSIPELLPKDIETNRKLFAPGTPFINTLVMNSERTGIKFLGIYLEPFFQVTANRKITTPEDFKGLKIRTMNSPIIFATYKALGANPTPVPFSEVYSGLQTNMIDAQENPLDIIFEMSYFEVQQYLIETNHSAVVNMLYISRPIFDSMPENLQEIVINGGRVAQDDMFDYVSQLAETSRKKLLETGKIELMPASEEIVDAYKQASAEAKGAFLGLVGEEEGNKLLDALQKQLDNN